MQFIHHKELKDHKESGASPKSADQRSVGILPAWWGMRSGLPSLLIAATIITGGLLVLSASIILAR